MSIEIERKFLVRDDRWRAQSAGSQGWRFAKAMQPNPAPAEFEYAVPAAEAEAMLAAFAEGPVIEKQRHRVRAGRHCFELDEFRGANQGLVIAEIELVAADEEFLRPPWLGDEVTDDGRFYNFRLATAPFWFWPAPARASVATGRAPPGAGA